LATSPPEQWERPTLCDRWRVRDVVAHLISYDDLDIPGLLRRLAVGRLNLNQTNAAGVAEYATASCEEL
jgi:mycothiol maleylpyruvate isomerase-like protein